MRLKWAMTAPKSKLRNLLADCDNATVGQEVLVAGETRQVSDRVDLEDLLIHAVSKFRCQVEESERLVDGGRNVRVGIYGRSCVGDALASLGYVVGSSNAILLAYVPHLATSDDDGAWMVECWMPRVLNS